MTKSFRAVALVCSLTALPLCLTSVPAKAGQASEQIRTAQMQLAELGYFVGRYDGMAGPVTRSAVAQFQRNNGLPVSGTLTQDTYSLLWRMDYALRNNANLHSAYSYRYGYYRGTPFLSTSLIDWDGRWHSIRTQSIPSRYGKIDVNEERYGSFSNFTITLNGKPVFIAKNQPSILHVSQAYPLAGEDALVVTAYQGESGCMHKNYVIALRHNNTYTGPQEIGRCSEILEARVSNGALFMTFRNSYNGWAANTVWRYENGSAFQL